MEENQGNSMQAKYREMAASAIACNGGPALRKLRLKTKKAFPKKDLLYSGGRCRIRICDPLDVDQVF